MKEVGQQNQIVISAELDIESTAFDRAIPVRQRLPSPRSLWPLPARASNQPR